MFPAVRVYWPWRLYWLIGLSKQIERKTVHTTLTFYRFSQFFLYGQRVRRRKKKHNIRSHTWFEDADDMPNCSAAMLTLTSQQSQDGVFRQNVSNCTPGKLKQPRSASWQIFSRKPCLKSDHGTAFVGAVMNSICGKLMCSCVMLRVKIVSTLQRPEFGGMIWVTLWLEISIRRARIKTGVLWRSGAVELRDRHMLSAKSPARKVLLPV